MKHKILLFTIACAVVATLVAPLAFLFFLSDEIPAEKHITLITLWCMLPFIWGMWSLLMPASWLPNRIPQWGALLGLILGGVLILLFDLPNLIFDLTLSIPSRILVVFIIGVGYYFLWMIVKMIYKKIQE